MQPLHNSCTNFLKSHIQKKGPLSVFQFMEICLLHPQFGYYCTANPIGGKSGDFMTAPEVSQMFGELIGLWFLAQWIEMGAPQKIALIEMGPGKGTLLKDFLRAAAIRPDFIKALQINLIEVHPTLRDTQEKILKDYHPQWHTSLAQALGNNDSIPYLILANEFLDALPIQQYQKSFNGWHERTIDYDEEQDEFFFSLDDQCVHFNQPCHAKIGTIKEISPLANKIIQTTSTAISQRGGAALFIDYGYEDNALGETLQALQNHNYTSPLNTPGLCDLSAHVNFQPLLSIVNTLEGLNPFLMPQGTFLQQLGIENRAKTLMHQGSTTDKTLIDAALYRLTHSQSMGSLFKVLGFYKHR